MAGFGGAIKLTGESEYRNALSKINSSLKVTASEMKVVASEFDKSDSSTQALAAKTEVLKKRESELKESLSLTAEQLKKYRQAQEENVQKHKALEERLSEEKKKLAEIEQQYGKNSQEYKEQKQVVEQLEQAVEKSNKTNEQNIKTIQKTETELNNVQAELNQTETEMKQLEGATESTGEAAKSASDGFTVMKGVLSNLASQVIQKAIEGFKTLAKNIYEAGTTFDESMSKVAAISGATGKDLDALTAKAKQMGETTKFSASESAEAFTYMAMAGWKTEDMLNGIEGVMNLAAASGADLATTSDIVTDALTAMGYSAEDAGRLADVMAAASSNANTNVEMMGETFKYAASVAGSLGYSMEDVALATGLMANSGIKAEQAGTSLRAVMQRLATNTGKATDAVNDLGIEVTNADGSMRPLATVIEELRKKMSGLTDEQKTATAKTIAGTQAMGGLLAIINASESDYNKLSDAIKNSTGSAEKMAKTMQNNVAGKMTLLKSQLEGIYLTIWEKLEPAISRAIKTISEALKNVNWDKFGKMAGDALNGIIDGFTWLINNYKIVVTGIKAVITAFVVTKVVNFATAIAGMVTKLGDAVKAADTFTGALKGIFTTISTNPIGLLAGAIAGVGVAVAGLITSMQDADDEMETWADHIQAQTDAINENKDSWNELKDAQKEALSADMSNLTYVENLKNELLGLVDANGKVKEGYEGRAQFILGQLNDALGTEYKMTGNIIDNYGEMVKSIDTLIAKKKAEAILNAQAALYEEAISKQADAYLNLNKISEDYNKKQAERQLLEAARLEILQGLGTKYTENDLYNVNKRITAADEELTNLENNKNQQADLIKQYEYNIATYETNAQLAQQERYDEMTTASWEYVSTLSDAADQRKAILEGEVTAAESRYNNLVEMNKKAGNDMYSDQVENAKKTLEAKKKELDTYNTTIAQGLTVAQREWADGQAKELSTLTDSEVKFEAAGDGQLQMYVNGIKQGSKIPVETMKKITDEVVKKVKDGKVDAKTAGEYLVDGVTSGVKNQSKQSSAFSAIYSFGNSLLAKLKASLKEKSPSKATKEMGEFLLEGLGLGIKSEEDTVLDQVEKFGENVIDAMNGGLNNAIDTSAIANIKNAIPENVAVKYSASSAASSTSLLEYNSMVRAFKEALGQVKIEMDDQEMGQFVDKTVTRLVYN